MSETYDLYRRAREHMKQGMNAQATVALEKAKRREPDKASIREALGIAYYRIRRFAEAESEFRAIIDLQPVDDYAHFAWAAASRSRAAGRSRRPPAPRDALPPAEPRVPGRARALRANG